MDWPQRTEKKIYSLQFIDQKTEEETQPDQLNLLQVHREKSVQISKLEI